MFETPAGSNPEAGIDRRPPHVWSIAPDRPFVDTLAAGLIARVGDDPLALARSTILLPTRRSARALTEAFLRVRDGRALLLPRMIALGELEADEDPADAAELPPALDRLERQLTLARLVMARPGAFAVAPDQALRLAAALADLIDEVETEQADFAGLAELAPEEFAAHWQKTLEFLQIVTLFWPAHLAERGAIDPARRRVLALERHADRWSRRPPADPVIAAGFINADPALARLLAVVARLPDGAVILPGLDLELDNLAWDAVAPTHPQFGLKTILAAIGVERRAIRPWTGLTQLPAPRVRLLSEALRPAETTDAWRNKGRIAPTALGGLLRVDCATAGEEAEVIALAMRRTLETPGRTAALVTPDRGLARRVAAALRRWDIEVDDSAGRSLAETPVGIWLLLIAEAAASGFAPRPLLAMLKHPFAACGLPPETLREHVRLLERAVLRGPRPAPGLNSLIRLVQQAKHDSVGKDPEARGQLIAWLESLDARLAPFVARLATGGTLGELVAAHGQAAEALAETRDEAGALRLWRGEDGEAAAALLARLDVIGGAWAAPVGADHYPAILATLMRDAVVRPLYGAHPRLFIWGLIEARLQRADLMILGGLNEGTWPPAPGEEPWMSRSMRAAFGLPALETRIGLAAQDFALAAAAPEVILTRAARVEGAPSVAARFLSRLDAVLAGEELAIDIATGEDFQRWAAALDDPGEFRPWPRAAFAPPLAARPTRLSVTAIETWRRDPYALYAQRILRLRALDPLDADPGAAERGQFIHEALDRFVRDTPGTLPADSLQRLLAIGRDAFGEALDHPAVAAFWWPRFVRVAGWFLSNYEAERRKAGLRTVATECEGGLDLAVAGAAFRLTCTADRIDRRPDGLYEIIDYKTGQPPKPVAVVSGWAPQLPLEALILEAGGFRGISADPVGALGFLRLGGGQPPGEACDALGKKDDLRKVLDATRAGLHSLIEAYRNPAAAYVSKPRPDLAYPGDYDHLARVDEWMAAP